LYEPETRPPEFEIVPDPVKVPGQGVVCEIVNVAVEPLTVPEAVPPVSPVVKVPVNELPVCTSVKVTVSVKGPPPAVPFTVPV
jgi:hypothetical protein